MKISAPLLLLAASGLASLFAWRAHDENRTAQSQLSALQQNRISAETKILAITERLARAEEAAATHRSLLAAATAKAAPPAALPTRRNLSRLIDDSPELQNLKFAARRSQFAITYGPFYRRAALTPQQIQTFEQNLLRREERQADIMATATAQNASLRDPAYRKLLVDADADYQSAQRSLFGDAAAKEFVEYERTAPTREIVSALAGATAMAGEPLDATQAEQLTHVIAASTQTPSFGTHAGPPSVNWNVVHEQAKTFLSPAQLTYIETTEFSGPRGRGGRFMPALDTAIDTAAREELAAGTPLTP